MYCLLCGQRMVEKLLPTEDRPRAVCERCGYVHYINPKVVAGTLPLTAGGVWLLRRAIEPRLGYWTHPAGYQEVGESTEEGAIRETWEEMMMTVRITGLLGVYSRNISPVVNVIYLAAPVDPHLEPRPSKESLEVAHFTPATLPWEDLAFPSTAHALRDWLKRGERPPE